MLVGRKHGAVAMNRTWQALDPAFYLWVCTCKKGGRDSQTGAHPGPRRRDSGQPRGGNSPSADERVNTAWSTLPADCDSALKRKEVPTPASTGVGCERHKSHTKTQVPVPLLTGGPWSWQSPRDRSRMGVGSERVFHEGSFSLGSGESSGDTRQWWLHSHGNLLHAAQLYVQTVEGAGAAAQWVKSLA